MQSTVRKGNDLYTILSNLYKFIAVAAGLSRAVKHRLQGMLGGPSVHVLHISVIGAKIVVCIRNYNSRFLLKSDEVLWQASVLCYRENHNRKNNPNWPATYYWV